MQIGISYALGRLLLSLAITFVVARSSWAGTIVVSGDGTPCFYLTNTEPDPAVPGNRRFFTNILGPGTSVAVLSNSFSGNDAEAHEFYGSLPGVSSTLIFGPLTAANLSGKNLLIAATPDHALAASEISAIAGLLGSGGTVFFMGESSAIDFGVTTNGFIRSALTSLGSGLGIGDSHSDPGLQTVSPIHTASHPLTTGVTNFTYGATANITGGTPLFMTQNGTPFVSVQENIVPEPAGVVLGLVVAAACMRTRRRRVVTVFRVGARSSPSASGLP
jgi:hypothetical protein